MCELLARELLRVNLKLLHVLEFQALNMVTLKRFSTFVAGQCQCSTQADSRIVESVWAPTY